MTLTSSNNNRTSHSCSMKRKEREEARHWEIGPSHQCLRTTETQLIIRAKREKRPRRPRKTTIAQLRTCKGKCLKIRWFFWTTSRLRISSLKSNRKGTIMSMLSIIITIALATWTIFLTRTSLLMIETRLAWIWTNSRVRIWTSPPWAAVEPAAPGRRPSAGKCRTPAMSLRPNLGCKIRTLWSLIILLNF